MQFDCRNYLSIESSFSGLPALQVLLDLCQHLKVTLGLEEEPLLCRLFGLILGSGLGGVDAILIGRLQLEPARAIEAYKKLAPFIPIGRIQEHERKNITELFREAFAEILADVGMTSDTPMLTERTAIDASKTAVITATFKEGFEQYHPLRSYDVRGKAPTRCTIIDAACACIASPEGILSVDVGSRFQQIMLFDATATHANPTKVLIHELGLVFGGDSKVGTILSIGPGHWGISTMRIQLESTETQAFEWTSRSCEDTHHEMSRLLSPLAVYARMSVYRCNDSEADLTSIRGAVDQVATMLHNPADRVTLEDIVLAALPKVILETRPSTSQSVMGRTALLDSLVNSHLEEINDKTDAANMSILTGPDGVGKSEVALCLASEYKAKYPEFPVFIMDARSEDSLRAGFEDIIRTRGRGTTESSHRDAVAWLTTEQKHWMIILEDVGMDLCLRLAHYLPQSNEGNIIVTCTESGYEAFSLGTAYEIKALTVSEATNLLLRASSYEETEKNGPYAEKIAETLHCSPLLLKIAANYMRLHQNLDSYLDTHQNQVQHQYSSLPNQDLHYTASVETTIQLSFEDLPSNCRHTLQILSVFQGTVIPSDIIKQAAATHFRYIAYRFHPNLPDDIIEQADVLMNIFCPEGYWSDAAFDELISPGIRHSLIQVTAESDCSFYYIHPVIQRWIAKCPEPIQEYHPTTLAARILASCIILGEDRLTLAYHRRLLPLIQHVEQRDMINTADCYAIGKVLWESGDSVQAAICLLRCVETLKEELGEEHPDTLRAMNFHASCCFSAGHREEALEYKQKVLESQMRLPKELQLGILRTLGSISSCLLKMDRPQEALKARQELLEKQMELLGDEHFDLLTTMSHIISQLTQLERHQEARQMKERIYEKKKQILGHDHPDTLAARSIVASFSALGEHPDALELQDGTLKVQGKILGDQHQQTMRTTGGYASSLTKDNKRPDLKEASRLQERLLRKQESTLGKEHPDTLTTMASLASTLWKLDHRHRALEMKREVLAIQQRILGDEETHTLQSMMSLATSLSASRLHQEAMEIGAQALEIQRRIIGENCTDFLRTSSNVSAFEFTRGLEENDTAMKNKALKEQERVWKKQKELLGADYKDTQNTWKRLSKMRRQAKQASRF